MLTTNEVAKAKNSTICVQHEYDASSKEIVIDGNSLLVNLLSNDEMPVCNSDAVREISIPTRDTEIAEKLEKQQFTMDFSFPDKDLGFDEKIIAIIQSLFKQNFIFGKDEDGVLYRYKRKKGCFVRLSNKSIGTEDSFSAFLLNNVPDTLRITVTNSNIVKAVYQYLVERRNVAKLLPQIPDDRYVNLKNGVLDLVTLELKAHSPEYGFKFVVNAEFKADLELNAISNVFFDKLAFSEKEKLALLQVIGLAISNIRDWQLSPFIVGDPANGKSTLCNFLQKLIPEANSIATSFENWKDQFHAVNFSEAHFSVCADMSTGKLSKGQLAMFKMLVAGDRYGARRLYRDFGSIRSRCLMIFAGNGVPYFDDQSGAILRRIWYIKTGQSIPAEERHPDILKQLLDDRNAIVSKSLLAIAKVFNRQEPLLASDLNDDRGCNKLPVEVLLKVWVENRVKAVLGNNVSLERLYKEFLRENGISGEWLSYLGFTKLIRRFYERNLIAKKNGVSTLLGHKLSEKDEETESAELESFSGGYWD